MKDRDKILNGTPQQAAQLLTELESGYRAAYQAAPPSRGHARMGAGHLDRRRSAPSLGTGHG